MFWIPKAVLIGDLVLGGTFALCLFLDWLLRFLKVHFQNQKKDR